MASPAWALQQPASVPLASALPELALPLQEPLGLGQELPALPVRSCATIRALRATFPWSAQCLWVWSGRGLLQCETLWPPPPDLPRLRPQATFGWTSSCARS